MVSTSLDLTWSGRPFCNIMYFGQDHIISFGGRGRNEKGTANSSGEEIALNVYIILFTSSPFILFCEKVFHSLSPCIFCYSLQQLKCLLKQLQQELFKLYRHTILRQQFINTSHCWDTYRKQNTTGQLLNYYRICCSISLVWLGKEWQFLAKIMGTF